MLTRRMSWAVALTAMATMSVSYFDRSTLATLAPSVTAALHISETEYGWLTSAFSIAYLVAAPVGGRWIDDLGARRGLPRSVLAWSIVAALHALVPGFASLFALRIALGVAEGPSFPGAAQTVQRALAPADRPRGFGVLFVGSSIGGMAAPVVASWLFGVGGWRVAFLGTAVVGLAWVPMWIAITRRRDVRTQLDRVADDVPAAPRDTPGTPPWSALVRHPLVIRGVIAVFASAPAIGLVMYWGAKILAQRYGVHQVDVGHYLWLPPLCMDAGMLLFGDLASRRRDAATGSPPRLLFAIALVLATSLAALPLATTAWQAIAVFGVALAGGGGLYTLITADLLGRLPPGSVALAGGILAASQSLALIIASPLIGASVQRAHGYTPVAIALGAWVVPGALAWLAWPGLGRHGAAAPGQR